MSDDTEALVAKARDWAPRAHDPGTYTHKIIIELAATIERLERELADARRDAEYFRYMRDHPLTFGTGHTVMWTPDGLYAAIDAARENE